MTAPANFRERKGYVFLIEYFEVGVVRREGDAQPYRSLTAYNRTVFSSSLDGRQAAAALEDKISSETAKQAVGKTSVCTVVTRLDIVGIKLAAEVDEVFQSSGRP